MAVVVVEEEEEEEEYLDWKHVLDIIPEAMMPDLSDGGCFIPPPPPPPVSDLSAEAPVESLADPHSSRSVSSWIGEVEHFLMKDDDGYEFLVDSNPQICTDFLSDVLLESLPAAADDREAASSDKCSAASEGGGDPGKKMFNASNVNHKNNDEDPISKKRGRQLRNRDAALRSRERRKMYVRDLEVKSRYLEGECRRLERLLQCCSAENHSLRFQLYHHKGFGASTTKQESAVLLLESLLLGSLLWLLGISYCLFPLLLPGLAQEQVTPLESAEGGVLERIRQKAANKNIPLLPSRSLRRSCRASRTKMKSITLSFCCSFGVK